MVIPSAEREPWGIPPWRIDFTPPQQPLPRSVDFAVVGAGFTGLAAAVRLRQLAPGKSVAVLEADRVGAGASGRTGGIPLAESAAGDLPGLGDVLKSFAATLRDLQIECDLSLAGAYEIGRHGKALANSPIDWQDSGRLRVVREVPGGTLDAGKLVSGLARAAHSLGTMIFDHVAVEEVGWTENAVLSVVQGRDGRRAKIAADKILLAANASSLRMAGLDASTYPKLALVALTAPVSEELLGAVGLAARKPFYTVDFPYLWGRVCRNEAIMWGAGLLDPPESGDVAQINLAAEEPLRAFAHLEQRVRGLHPALQEIRFTHYWGGPILFRDDWRPVFAEHPRSSRAIVLGAYAGHGVALSVHLGFWAAEALLGRRELPDWGRISQD